MIDHYVAFGYHKMRSIYKVKKGKDFYKDALEYFEYDENLFEKDEREHYVKDDDELSYIVEISTK